MSGAATSRYDTIVKLASGGMATVWVGTVRGALGFRQLVAIKKPHPHLLEDVSYRNELIAEARLASLINHANVVDVRDVEVDGGEIGLVIDYMEGASLGELVVAAAKRGMQLPPRVAVRIALDALAGLHAAHELVDERGRHVGLVHRDISPQNILVGVDGLARVADFGIAKFSNKKSETSEGSLKGKLAYMAPEYLRGEAINRRFDVFAVGIVLWESLAGKRLFRGANEAETVRLLLDHQPEPLASVAPAAAALDGVVSTALSRSLEGRFQNAQAMAAALESTALAAGLCGGHTEVAATLKELVGASIEERRTLVRAKLAHEPSVASLMGVSPEALPAAAALAPPVTVLNAPPTAHANAPATAHVVTPKLGGGAADVLGATAIAPTERNAPPTFAVPATVAAPPTAVPSTLPMTPRMEGAPGAERTLTSASAPPPAALAPGVGMSTLASPAMGAMGAPPPRAEIGADTQLSFNEPSARTAHDVSTVGVPRPSRTVPVIAGVAAILAAAVGITFGIRASKSKASTPPTIDSTAIAAQSAPPPPPSSSAAAATTITTATSASASASPPTAVPTPATGGRRPVRGAGPAAASAAAPAQPSATTKKPPPNPYANE